MPSTTDERAARWPGMDAQATIHLEGRGFILSRDGRWEWSHPNPEHHVSARDLDAMIYLIQEWDFGNLGDFRFWEKPEFTEADMDQAFKETPKWEDQREAQFYDWHGDDMESL